MYRRKGEDMLMGGQAGSRSGGIPTAFDGLVRKENVERVGGSETSQGTCSIPTL